MCKVSVKKINDNKTIIYCCVFSKNGKFTIGEITNEIISLRNTITKYEINNEITKYLQAGLIRQSLDGYKIC